MTTIRTEAHLATILICSGLALAACTQHADGGAETERVSSAQMAADAGDGAIGVTFRMTAVKHVASGVEHGIFNQLETTVGSKPAFTSLLSDLFECGPGVTDTCDILQWYYPDPAAPFICPPTAAPPGAHCVPPINLARTDKWMHTARVEAPIPADVPIAVRIFTAGDFLPGILSFRIHLDSSTGVTTFDPPDGSSGIQQILPASVPAGGEACATMFQGPVFCWKVEIGAAPPVILPPFDVVEADPATNALFPENLNGYKLNPRWQWQTAVTPDALSYNDCTESLDQIACTHQGTTKDDDPHSQYPFVCSSDLFGNGGVGHRNWEAAIYHGQVQWGEHSCFIVGPKGLCFDSPDDDYNFYMQTPVSPNAFNGFPSGTTKTNSTITFGTPPSPAFKAGDQAVLKLEFNAGEVINRLLGVPGGLTGPAQYWRAFKDDVDLGVDDPMEISRTFADDDGIVRHHGTEAIVFGLFGLDREHDAASEIHPVWGMALHTNTDPSNDTWDFFMRNYGNEGQCSHEQHYLGQDSAPFDFIFHLSRPTPDPVDITVLESSFASVGPGGSAPPTVSTAGPFVTFHMLGGHNGPRILYTGRVRLKWGSVAAPAPPVLVPNGGSALPQEKEDTEERVKDVLSTLTPEQLQTYHFVQTPPHPDPDPVIVQAIVTHEAPPPATPPLVFPEDDPDQGQHQGEVFRGLCAALGGQTPTDLAPCSTFPPITVLMPDGGASGNNGWSVAPITVTLTAVDTTHSGLATTEYSFDGTTFTPYLAPFVVPEGQTTITYRSRANDGTLEPANQRSFKVDTRSPTATGTLSGPNHATLTYQITDPSPGSGPLGLHTLVQGAAGPVSGFVSGASGSVALATQCSAVELWAEDAAGNLQSPHAKIADSVPPVFTSVPPTIQTVRCAATAGITLVGPTATDDCGVTITGTVLADSAISQPIAIRPGASVVLPLGTHHVTWVASDGTSSVSTTQTIVVRPAPIEILANGDVQLNVTLNARQAYVEAFGQRSGVQNVSGNIVSSEVNNGDGTFSYKRVVPASQYHAGDVVKVRFYSYLANSPGVFTPGPIDQVWFADVVYGQATACPSPPPGRCQSQRLALSGAQASSQESSSYPAVKAIDANFTTRWSSAFRDPQWLYVDLGAPRFIDRALLYWENAASANYDIQVSNDAVNWTTLFNEPKGNGSTDEIGGLNSVGRYVRVFSRQRTTTFGDSLFEVEVYGDANTQCR